MSTRLIREAQPPGHNDLPVAATAISPGPAAVTEGDTAALRGSYSHHCRRGLPKLLKAVTFRSSNEAFHVGSSRLYRPGLAEGEAWPELDGVLSGKTIDWELIANQYDQMMLTGRATDDVLELFDLLMVADLMSKAERGSRDEKLRRYPRVSRYAGKLASAVKVLLEVTEAEPDLSLDMMWDLIENTATKSELRAAVAVIEELAPVDDAELNGQRLQELAGRLATVRVFLPLMMRTVVFGAAADGAPVLAAMKALAGLMAAKSKLPGGYLDLPDLGGSYRPLRDPDSRDD